MRRPSFLTIILAVFLAKSTLAQNANDTILAKDNVMFPLPTVSVNFGFLHAFSDVGLSDGPSPFKQLGYQLTITQRVTKFMNAGFELFTGTVYGEEQRNLSNLNYRTSLVSPRIGLEYNFYPLLKPNAAGRQLIRPYVGFGVGMVLFRSKGDLEDESGNTYHYWSNGLIYAEEEGSVDISEATQLERDYVYETELRDANLDGFRKYSQLAFTLPVNAGIRFQLSKNVGINAAFSYVLNFTDLIDNINDESVGIRQGNSNFDNHLFGSVGLSVFLGRTKPSSQPTKRFDDMLASDEEKALVADSSTDSEMADTSLVAINPILVQNEVKDPLAKASQELAKASESFKKLSEKSEQLVAQTNSQLEEITERKIQSKKELREAKQESIAILENSIVELNSTNSEINETNSRLEMAYSDLSAEQLTTGPSSAEKIESTVKSTIPAVESLKQKIQNAKSPEELKSIMNIASKNLSHTNEIFTEESKRMNETILGARRSVVQKRTELLLMNTKDVDNIAASDLTQTELQLANVEKELEELRNQGAISEEQFTDMIAAVTKSRQTVKEVAQATQKQQDEQVMLNSEQSDLADAANQLISVSEILSKSNKIAEKTLTESSEQLNLIAGKDLKTKEELKAAKEAALKVLEASVSALNESEVSINEASTKLTNAGVNLGENDFENPLASTGKISSSVSSTESLLESSKAQVKSSKNAEELQSILKLASASIDRTVDVVSEESKLINQSILQARKTVLDAKADQLASNSEDQVSEELTEAELKIFKNEVQALQSEGILEPKEVKELGQTITEAELKSNNAVVVNRTVADDNLLEVVSEMSSQVSESVDNITNENTTQLTAQKDRLNTAVNDLSEVKSKKQIRAKQSELKSILEESELVIAESQQKMKLELAKLKRAKLPATEVELPALTQQIQLIEAEIQHSNETLNKLGDVSVAVQNADKSEELASSTSKLSQLIDEHVSYSSSTQSSATDLTNSIENQIVEARISNLNKAKEVQADVSNYKVEELKTTLKNEVAELADRNVIDEAKEQELVKKITSTEAAEVAMESSTGKSVDSNVKTKESASNPDNQSLQETKPKKSTPKKSRPTDLSLANFEETKPKETGGYHWADLNKNNWISPDEVLFFIDLLFEGEADRSVEDIQNLIDYYFDQE